MFQVPFWSLTINSWEVQYDLFRKNSFDKFDDSYFTSKIYNYRYEGTYTISFFALIWFCDSFFSYLFVHILEGHGSLSKRCLIVLHSHYWMWHCSSFASRSWVFYMISFYLYLKMTDEVLLLEVPLKYTFSTIFLKFHQYLLIKSRHNEFDWTYTKILIKEGNI